MRKFCDAINEVKNKPNVVGMILMLGALIFAMLIPLPPMNQTITVVFDRNLPSQAMGTAVSSRQGVKKQRLEVSGRNLSYRPDPLTYDAESVELTLKNLNGARVVRLDAEVNVDGRHWWTVHRIPSDQLSLQQSDSNTEQAEQTEQSSDSITLTISHNQMRDMVRGWKLFNPGRLALMMLILATAGIVIVKRFLLHAVPLPWFLSGVGITVLTLMGVWRVWLLDAPIRGRLVNIIVLLAFLALVAVNVAANTAIGAAGRSNAKTSSTATAATVVILADYAVMLFAAFAQGLLYILKWSHSPDEIAHLSYVAWEKAHHQLIPDFANVSIYETVFNGYADLDKPLAFNQLGHPPLYYLLMSLVPGTHVSGSDVTYHVAWLRMVSLIILLLGLALCAYLLYTRLPRNPMLHMVAAIGLIACPNMVQVSAGVNNDSLCLLTVTVTIWGCLRFRERHYDWRTNALIMVGLSATLLTKLTAGMIAALLCLFVLVAALMEAESRVALKTRSFWATTPILLLPIAYYSAVFVRYHSIQPSYQQLDLKGYLGSTFYTAMEKRSSMSIMQYVDYYITQFLRTWWSMPWQSDLPRSGVTSFDPRAIALTLLLLVPFVVLCLGRTRRDRTGNFLAMGLVAILLTAIYQFHNAMNGYYINGYMGGLQSRYYLCAMLILVYALCWLLQRWFISPQEPEVPDIPESATGHSESIHSVSMPTHMSRIGTLVCSGFVMLLVWDGLLQPFLLQPVGLSALA